MATKILETNEKSESKEELETGKADTTPAGYIKTQYVLLGALAIAGAFSLFGRQPHKSAAPPSGAQAAALPVARNSSLESSAEAPNDEIHRQALGTPALPSLGVNPHAGLENNPHATLHANPGVPVTETEKPEGPLGRSIAELYQQVSALENKRVRLRGTVVRSTSGIKGLTYIHLRDGTGDAQQRTNDVTVTTGVEVQVGDQIELEGTVRRDVDLGLGYKYSLMVEAALLLSKLSAVQAASASTASGN